MAFPGSSIFRTRAAMHQYFTKRIVINCGGVVDFDQWRTTTLCKRIIPVLQAGAALNLREDVRHEPV